MEALPFQIKKEQIKRQQEARIYITYQEIRQKQIQKKTENRRAQLQKIRRQMKNKRSTYNWNLTQNRHYMLFLMKNKQLYSLSNQQKKRIKLNVMLSQKVKTRTSTQCHTHHQKMMKKHGNIDGIVQNLKRYYLMPNLSSFDIQQKPFQELSQMVEIKAQFKDGTMSYKYFPFVQLQNKDPVVGNIKIYVEDEQADYLYY